MPLRQEIANSTKTLSIMWNFSMKTLSPATNTTLKSPLSTCSSCYPAIKLRSSSLNFSLSHIKISKIPISPMLSFSTMPSKKETTEKYSLSETKIHSLNISAPSWIEYLRPFELKLPKVHNVHMPRFLWRKHSISSSSNLQNS